ncbi:MAG: hypothetical protein U9R53_06945, partial [Chloroflexota bacterium]|nr:hypothetical protein [Chloroflexota bacterium]
VSLATVRAIGERARRPTLQNGLNKPRGNRSAVLFYTGFYYTRGRSALAPRRGQCLPSRGTLGAGQPQRVTPTISIEFKPIAIFNTL